MPDFWRETTPASGKVRRCNWCGESIPTGERHVYVATTDEGGDFVAFRMHTECREAMDHKRGSTEER
jgi:ribosomal protein L24E